MDIGSKISQLRKKNNLSQEALAEKVGVARQTISKWELSETCPDLKQAKKLAEIFEVSLDELADTEFKADTYQTVINPESKSKRKIGAVKATVICLLIFLIITAPVLLGMAVKKYQYKDRNVRYSTVECDLHGEKYFYEFKYYEEDGQIIEAGGDGYLADITEIEQYGNAYQAINIIDAYVKNNGGKTLIKEGNSSQE